MSDRESLKSQILTLLKNGNDDGIFLYNLCKTVNQPKKFVNSVLYDLQKNGLIQKVVDSPPLWKIVRPNVSGGGGGMVDEGGPNEMRSVKSSPCSRGDNTANRKPFPVGRSTILAQTFFQQQSRNIEETLHPDSWSFNNGPRNHAEINSHLGNFADSEDVIEEDTSAGSFSRSIPSQNTVNSLDLGEAILSHLRNFSRPTQTLELVSALGCANKKVVNFYLYTMRSKGLVEKVQEIPPFWQLVSFPNGSSLPTDSFFLRKHSQGPGAQTSLVNSEVPATEYSKPPKANQESTPIIHSNETKEAILKYLRMTKKPTGTLEIVSALGLMHKKVANPELYSLKSKGLVEKVQESPPLWQIKDESSEDTDSSKEKETKVKSEVNDDPLVITEPAESQPPPNRFHKQRGGGRNNEAATPNSGEGLKSPGAPFSSGGDTHTPSPNPMCNIQGSLLPPQELLKNTNFSDSRSAANSSECNQNAIPQLHNDNNILALADDENSGNALGALNMESFAALMKNPMSALHEYGQKHRVDAKIDIVETKGPSHQPMFKAAASIGDQILGESWASTKKDAKRQAAELAVRYLVAKQAAEINSASKYLEMGSNATLFDIVAGISHHIFNLQALRIPEYVSGRKVLATIVMQSTSEDKGTVVSFGTGNRCITGEHLNQDGLIINDSHAEVIARRGLLRFLYAQLQKFCFNSDHPIFEMSTNKEKLRVREGVTFHLYISTAPCGDGALFTRTAKLIDCPEPKNGDHAPLMLNNLQGLLRTKMEAGEGTIPVDTKVGVQAWDAILLGERLRTMSCSDKIARWNVIGLQGALLSHFIEPLYLSSVTLGNLFHHGHISRALCCRLKGNAQLDEGLPEGFRLNHPKLGQISAFNPPRETEKTRQYSINWAVGDDKPELTNGVTGACEQRFQSQSESRICKNSLFESFKKICAVFDRRELLGYSYAETKRQACDFQFAKKVLFKQCIDCGLGTWVQKPPEEEMFS